MSSFGRTPPVRLPALPVHLSIDHQVGEGAHARVFAGRDGAQDRPIALKVVRLPPDSDHVTRFRRECRIQSGLVHPHIVRIHDFHVAADVAWLSMDLCESTLARVVDGEVDADAAQLFAWGGQLLEALEYLHERGCVHRDVKPSNVLVDGSQVRLADFGLSLTELDSTADNAAGTAGYLAPELARGSAPSPATDVFAAGVTLCKLFRGLDLRPALENVLVRATSFDPADRYPSAAGFLRAYRDALREPADGTTAAETAAEPWVVQIASTATAPVTGRRRSWRRAGVLAAAACVAGTAVVVVPQVARDQQEPRRPAAAPASSAQVGQDSSPATGGQVADDEPEVRVGRVGPRAWQVRWAVPQTAQQVAESVAAEELDAAAGVPAPAGDDQYTGFVVTATPTNGSGRPAGCRSRTESCVLEGLDPGQEYAVTLTPYSGTTPGRSSAPVMVVTPPAFLDRPGAVALWLDASAPGTLRTDGTGGLQPGDQPDSWRSLGRSEVRADVVRGLPAVETTLDTGQQVMALAPGDELRLRTASSAPVVPGGSRGKGLLALAVAGAYDSPDGDEVRPAAVAAGILPDGGLELGPGDASAPSVRRLFSQRLDTAAPTGPGPGPAIRALGPAGGSLRYLVSEYIVLARPLTAREEEQVRTYLARKWSVPTSPSGVTDVAVEAAADGTALVTWSPVPSSDGLKVGYRLALTGGPGSCTSRFAWTGTCTGLVPGVRYRVSVVAVNDVGAGPAVLAPAFEVPPLRGRQG